MEILMKNFVILFIAILFSCTTTSQEVNDIRLLDIQTGTFMAHEVRKIVVGSDKKETLIESTEPELINNSDLVMIKKGVIFGVKCRFLDPRGSTVKAKLSILHPPFKDQKKDHENEVPLYGKYESGNFFFHGYQINHDYEMVPGVWTLEISVNEKVFLHKEFTLQ